MTNSNEDDVIVAAKFQGNCSECNRLWNDNEAVRAELAAAQATRDEYRKQLEDGEWKVEANLREQLSAAQAEIERLKNEK